MSYRFVLVERHPGATPEASIRAWLAGPETGQGPGPEAPEKEAAKERLAERLKEANPYLVASRPSAAQGAEPGSAAERQAREQRRVIELRDSRNGTGVQILLRDGSAIVSVPFWYKQDEAGVVMEEIWNYLRILTEEGDMVAYDPQLDQVLNLNDDKLAVIKGYAGF